jgi:uncharacterized membrane protein (DUF373 family)
MFSHLNLIQKNQPTTLPCLDIPNQSDNLTLFTSKIIIKRKSGMVFNTDNNHESQVELPAEHEDLYIRYLHKAIRAAVRVLALLMVFVVLWGIGDVVYVLYNRLIQEPFMLLSINDIFATFGAFLAVLIAIEIFVNITVYLRTDVIPVKLVVATALMAISRKVIVLDFDKISPPYVYATAAVVISLGVTYWLVARKM